jgi:hypothetical protein
MMRLPCHWLGYVCTFTLVLSVVGCGGGSTEPTATTDDELGAYLADNPDVAAEDAPDVDAE